jgi:hypothetical protein
MFVDIKKVSSINFRKGCWQTSIAETVVKQGRCFFVPALLSRARPFPNTNREPDRCEHVLLRINWCNYQARLSYGLHWAAGGRPPKTHRDRRLGKFFDARFVLAKLGVQILIVGALSLE